MKSEKSLNHVAFEKLERKHYAFICGGDDGHGQSATGGGVTNDKDGDDADPTATTGGN